MKKFKAEIKATTEQGGRLSVTCSNPKGLLVEALTFMKFEHGSEEAREFIEEILAKLGVK